LLYSIFAELPVVPKCRILRLGGLRVRRLAAATTASSLATRR